MSRTISVAFAAVLMTFLLVPGTASTAPVPANYGFEECTEGWVVTESRQEPLDDSGEWKPQSPGNPEGTPLQAFRSQPYPFAAQNGNAEEESYEMWLTSPTHTVTTPGDITFMVKHNIETVPENPGVITGGDFLYAEMKVDGGPWQKKGTFTGTSAGYPALWAEGSVAAPAGQVKLRFYFYSDNNTSGEGNSGGEVAIDDISFPANRPTGTTCAGGEEPPPPAKCTKSGNKKNNTLKGTNKVDRLCGKGGNDKLYGKGGKDVLNGGPGNNDKCFGGPGKDTFKGCETKKQ